MHNICFLSGLSPWPSLRLQPRVPHVTHYHISFHIMITYFIYLDILFLTILYFSYFADDFRYRCALLRIIYICYCTRLINSIEISFIDTEYFAIISPLEILFYYALAVTRTHIRFWCFSWLFLRWLFEMRPFTYFDIIFTISFLSLAFSLPDMISRRRHRWLHAQPFQALDTVI